LFGNLIVIDYKGLPEDLLHGFFEAGVELDEVQG